MMNYNREIQKIKSTETLRQLFNDFLHLTKNVLEDYNSRSELKYFQIVSANLLQRMYLSIKTITILFDEFNRNQYFKFPIGIQVRTALLDSITLTYLALFIDKTNDEKYREQVTRLNQPVARELKNEIEEQINNGKIKGEEISKQYEFAANHFPDNFFEGSKIQLKKSIKYLNPKDMAEKLKGTPLEWFSDCYKLYQHYSKYEHFGSITKSMLDFDPEYEFDKLTFSTFYIFCASLMAYSFMEVEKEKQEIMKKIRDSIIEVEPTFNWGQ